MESKFIERPVPMSEEERKKRHKEASNKYNKENYKKIQANIKPADFYAIEKYCKENGVSKAKLITAGCLYVINNKIDISDITE